MLQFQLLLQVHAGARGRGQHTVRVSCVCVCLKRGLDLVDLAGCGRNYLHQRIRSRGTTLADWTTRARFSGAQMIFGVRGRIGVRVCVYDVCEERARVQQRPNNDALSTRAGGVSVDGAARPSPLFPLHRPSLPSSLSHNRQPSNHTQRIQSEDDSLAHIAWARPLASSRRRERRSETQTAGGRRHHRPMAIARARAERAGPEPIGRPRVRLVSPPRAPPGALARRSAEQRRKRQRRRRQGQRQRRRRRRGRRQRRA